MPLSSKCRSSIHETVGIPPEATAPPIHGACGSAGAGADPRPGEWTFLHAAAGDVSKHARISGQFAARPDMKTLDECGGRILKGMVGKYSLWFGGDSFENDLVWQMAYMYTYTKSWISGIWLPKLATSSLFEIWESQLTWRLNLYRGGLGCRDLEIAIRRSHRGPTATNQYNEISQFCTLPETSKAPENGWLED